MILTIGDVIEWNDEQHIVDVTFQNQFFKGKTRLLGWWYGNGYSVSIICETHVVREKSTKTKR